MKAAGFGLILLAALLFSMQRIGAERKRVAALQSFCAMLEQFLALLESEAPPMPELTEKLGGRVKGPGRVFLRALSASMDRLGEKSFQELWGMALESCSALDGEARAALETLGAALGRYTLEAQGEALRACLAELRGQAERARTELPRRSRLTMGLSLTVLLLAIALL